MGLLSDTAGRTVLTDPATGSPLDVASPTQVRQENAATWLFSGSTSAANGIIGPFATDNASMLAARVTLGASDSRVFVEQSVDGTTWDLTPARLTREGSAGTHSPQSTISESGLYEIEAVGTQVRFRLNTVGTGSPAPTTQVAGAKRKIDRSGLVYGTVQGTTADGSSPRGNGVILAAEARTSARTAASNGNVTKLTASAIGHLLVQDTVSIGLPTDAAWDKASASASVISLLKRISLDTP